MKHDEVNFFIWSWEYRIIHVLTRNTRHALLINHDDNSHWPKRSPFDHTCSACFDWSRWQTVRQGGRLASTRKLQLGKKNGQAIGFRNEANATTRSPLAWRLVHSKCLVSPLARNRAAVSSLELSSSKASSRSRHYGSGACNGDRRREDEEAGNEDLLERAKRFNPALILNLLAYHLKYSHSFFNIRCFISTAYIYLYVHCVLT